MPDELTYLSAGELTAGYATGELSPVEATRSALAAIEAGNQDYHAFCLVDEENALARAAQSQQRWRDGEAASALDGVPGSIKDLYLTRGWPTLRGSLRVDPSARWSVDSPCATRLREAGVVLLGKTTTAEFGWKATTDNPRDGIIRNPWDTSKTPGGSSGGSGAALAAGMGAISLGTDAAGSARIPGSFCGVVGFKPSYGTIPLYPASDLATLANAGPMARSVADVGLLTELLAGPDPRDPNSLPFRAGEFTAAARREVRGLRVAFSPAFGRVDVDREVAAIVATAVEQTADAAGLVVELADPPFSDPIDEFTVLWEAGMARLLDSQLSGSTEGIDPGLGAVIEAGGAHSAADYIAARRATLELAIAMGEFHRDFDVLVTPTMPCTAFDAGVDIPVGSGVSSWPEWTPFTFPFNMSQQPALNVPIALDSRGLPVGLQIVGPRLSDGMVLAVGAAFERCSPFTASGGVRSR